MNTGTAKLLLLVYLAQHIALLRASFFARTFRVGGVGRIYALINAVAGRGIASQAIDILGIRHFDWVKLREHVLRRPHAFEQSNALPKIQMRVMMQASSAKSCFGLRQVFTRSASLSPTCLGRS